MKTGLILLNKPKGISSQQAIYHVRKKLALPKAIKIGHGGTLDPLATGMLVIALGSATKFLGYLLNANKTYTVTAKLGQVTSTLDTEGEVLFESAVPELSASQILAVFQKFTGQISQIPPMYSALKFQGKPLYHYARKGEEIPRPPRQVCIHNIKLDLELDSEAQTRPKDKISFITMVSKGTYIRSLVHDMGEVIGCGAHVEILHRAQVDPFLADEMHHVDQLDLDQLIPIERLFTHLPSLYFNAEEIKKLKSGQKLTEINLPYQTPLYKAYLQENNQCVALVKTDELGRIMGEKWV
jgi:tRNA pseudouridine55 synthase